MFFNNLTEEEERAWSKGWYVKFARTELEWLTEIKLSDREWEESKYIYEKQWEEANKK